MKKRASLAEIAKRRHMTEKAVITWALEEGGTPYGASMLLGISAPSIKRAMDKYGLSVETTHRVIEAVPS